MSYEFRSTLKALQANKPDSKIFIPNFTFLLFVLLFLVTGCENDVRQVMQVTTKQRIGVELSKGVKINYSVGGRPKAEITAPVMLRHQDTVPYIEFPNTIHGDFFDSLMNVESRLDAHYAKYMETESKVYLRDSVTIFNISGDTLHCDELYWDRAKTGHEFYTDKPVRIRTKTHVIDGVGLDASQDFKEWHILQPRGLVKMPSSQFPG